MAKFVITAKLSHLSVKSTGDVPREQAQAWQDLVAQIARGMKVSLTIGEDSESQFVLEAGGITIDDVPATAKQIEGLNLPVRLVQKDLSARAGQAFLAEDLDFLGGMVFLSESSVRRIPNVGKESIKEIRALLQRYDLDFDMKVKGWKEKPPQ